MNTCHCCKAEFSGSTYGMRLSARKNNEWIEGITQEVCGSCAAFAAQVWSSIPGQVAILKQLGALDAKTEANA